jgi:hypothetical protein
MCKSYVRILRPSEIVVVFIVLIAMACINYAMKHEGLEDELADIK